MLLTGGFYKDYLYLFISSKFRKNDVNRNNGKESTIFYFTRKTKSSAMYEKKTEGTKH